MKFRLEDCVQRGHSYAIVDEVDSILIDEARTPLIISGPSEESTDKYMKANRIIPKLIRGEVIEGKEPGEQYTDRRLHGGRKEPQRSSDRRGLDKAAELLELPRPVRTWTNIEWKHHVEQALESPRAVPPR